MNQQISQIVSLICFNNPELESSILTEINKAQDDPAIYLDEDDNYKFGRPIDIDDIEEVKFFLGIDLLLDAGLLCELDWKSDIGDVEYCINQMIRFNNILDINIEIPDDGQTLSEESFSDINQRILNDTPIKVLLVDINSDCYIFGIVSNSH